MTNNSNATSEMEKIIIPRVNVSIYRPRLSNVSDVIDVSELTRMVTPQPISLKRISDYDISKERLRDLLIDETAMFGKVARVNFAIDPQSSMYEKLLPNDHIEIVIDDANKPSVSPVNFIDKIPLPTYFHPETWKFLDNNMRKIGSTNFYGAVWKSSMSFRSTHYEMEIDAWDYLRLSQFYNIPRGVGEHNTTRTINIDLEQLKNLKENDNMNAKYSGTEQFRYRNHFLDYLNHCVEEYTRVGEPSVHGFGGIEDLSLQGYGLNVFFSTPIFTRKNLDGEVVSRASVPTSNLDQGVKVSLFTLYQAGRDSRAYKKSFTIPNSRRRAAQVLASNKAKVNLVNDRYVTAIRHTQKEKIKDIIANSKPFSINIFRVADAVVHFGGFQNNDQGESVYSGDHYRRVIMDIVSIDQFAAAKLLMSNMTVDHGINRWFTPILWFDRNYIQQIYNINKALKDEAQENADMLPSISQLVFARIYISERINAEPENITDTSPGYEDVRPFVVFNLDTFKILEYFNVAEDIALHQLFNKSDNYEDIPLFLLLSYFFSAVEIPQKYPTGSGGIAIYEITSSLARYFGNSSETASDAMTTLYNLINSYKLNVEKLPNVNTIEQLYKTIAQFKSALLSNISNTVSFLYSTLALDSKLVSFITNIPATYVRAEEFTGSKFKVFAYDSLPITRIVQILSSTMHGFPSTNNPGVSSTGTIEKRTGKVDHYPVFISNRVIIRSETIFAKEPLIHEAGKIISFRGNTTAREYMGENDEKDNTYMFILYVVGSRTQVPPEKAEYQVNVGEAVELDIVRGASTNHFFAFTYGQHAHYLSMLSTSDNNDEGLTKEEARAIVDKVGIRLSYAAGGKDLAGIAPPEMSVLNITDLTQRDDYNPWFLRYNANPTFEYRSNLKSPLHNPVVASMVAFPSSLQAAGRSTPNSRKIVYSDFDEWNNKEKQMQIDTQTNFNQSLEEVLKIQDGDVKNPLVGCIGFVDISDLKNEFAMLDAIANSENYGYFDSIASSHPDMFEHLFINSPVVFDIKTQGSRKYITLRQNQSRMSLKEFVSMVNDVLGNIKNEDMMWMFPIHGWTLYPVKIEDIESGSLQEQTFIDRSMWFKQVSVNNKADKILFKPFFNNLFFVSYIDLLAKSIRYMLWTLSKSRLLAHVYLPLQRRNKLLPLDTASSVVLRLPSDSLLRKSKSELPFGISNTVIKGIEEEGFSVFEREVVPMSTVVDQDAKPYRRPLVWYVSKKTTYVNSDVGAMTRLYMTEGAFDWTISFQEFNVITAITENFLVRGMNNFNLRAG